MKTKTPQRKTKAASAKPKGKSSLKDQAALAVFPKVEPSTPVVLPEICEEERQAWAVIKALIEQDAKTREHNPRLEVLSPGKLTLAAALQLPLPFADARFFTYLALERAWQQGKLRADPISRQVHLEK